LFNLKKSSQTACKIVLPSLSGFLSPGNGGSEGGVKTIEDGERLPLGERGERSIIIMKKETWKTIIQLVISVLTAVATTLGVTSCM